MGKLRSWIGARFASFFSNRVEDSSRLRALGLAALWVAAMSLYWVGGDLRFALGGGILGTVGHGLSYLVRNKPSRGRPLAVAVAVIILSLLMRNQMMEAFNGNWVPVGHYLVMVTALSTFDVRTRGGLYTGLVLSGMMLFFSSQQAFDYSFGVFVIGFIVVVLAFLVVSFLEDGIRSSQVHWSPNRPITLAYWIGATCGLFVMAGLAFLIIPRGDDNLIGPPQIAVLPYSQNNLGNAKEIITIDLEDLRLDEIRDSVLADVETSPVGSGAVEENNTPAASGGPDVGGGPTQDVGEAPTPADSGDSTTATDAPLIPEPVVGESVLDNPVVLAPVFTPGGVADQLPPAGSVGSVDSTPQAPAAHPQAAPTDGAAKFQLPGGSGEPAFVVGEPETVADDDVVFHVRSNVASYWRGKVLQDYDGTQWEVDSALQTMVRSRISPSFWFDRENADLDIRVRYQHTFFLNDDAETPISSGYQGLQVIAPNIDFEDGEAVLRGGTTYRAISALPEHSPRSLRRDRSRGSYPSLTQLMSPRERMTSLPSTV